MSISTISISLSVENVARADVLLTTTRAYYRFATIDTCEEGDMPYGNACDVFNKIEQAIATHSTTQMPQDVKCVITITNDDDSKNNYNNSNISLYSYNSLINILSRINDEFMFIRGFK